MGDRTKKLMASMDAVRKRRSKAIAHRRSRNRKTKPWKVLQEEWFEYAAKVYDDVTMSIPKWGVVEKQLARKLLNDKEAESVDIDTAIKMARLFIDGRHERGEVPHFKLFWAMRGTIRARVEGKAAEKKRELRKRREFDPDKAGRPKIGW
jgi:hypothetical protein